MGPAALKGCGGPTWSVLSPGALATLWALAALGIRLREGLRFPMGPTSFGDPCSGPLWGPHRLRRPMRCGCPWRRHERLHGRAGDPTGYREAMGFGDLLGWRHLAPAVTMRSGGPVGDGFAAGLAAPFPCCIMARASDGAQHLCLTPGRDRASSPQFGSSSPRCGAHPPPLSGQAPLGRSRAARSVTRGAARPSPRENTVASTYNSNRHNTTALGEMRDHLEKQVAKLNQEKVISELNGGNLWNLDLLKVRWSTASGGAGWWRRAGGFHASRKGTRARLCSAWAARAGSARALARCAHDARSERSTLAARTQRVAARAARALASPCRVCGIPLRAHGARMRARAFLRRAAQPRSVAFAA